MEPWKQKGGEGVRIEFGRDEQMFISPEVTEKGNKTAEAISELLDGFTVEEAERIIQRVRDNYGNATYRKEFSDQYLP